MEVLHLAGALMENFLEGSALLKGFGKLTEQFLQGNVPLRPILNEETMFMS